MAASPHLMAPTQEEEFKGDKRLASPQTRNSGCVASPLRFADAGRCVLQPEWRRRHARYRAGPAFARGCGYGRHSRPCVADRPASDPSDHNQRVASVLTSSYQAKLAMWEHLATKPR